MKMAGRSNHADFFTPRVIVWLLKGVCAERPTKFLWEG
jgi:hypothetical protein